MATEVIQVRVDATMKRELEELSAKRGVTLSQGIRDILSTELNRAKTKDKKSPAEEFDEILQEADERRKASGLPDPSIEQIVEFCDKVRAERIAEAMVV